MFIILYSFGKSNSISEIQYVFFKYQKNAEEFVQHFKDNQDFWYTIEQVKDVKMGTWIPCSLKK